jgi:hypothetical protein
MSVSEKLVGVATSSKQGFPHSEKKLLMLHLDEDVLWRIRVVAEARGKDHKTLVEEFIVQSLCEEEKREGLLEPSFRVVNGRKKETVEMYTDGGCRGNPGPGGWAVVVYEGPKPEEIYGYEKASLPS